MRYKKRENALIDAAFTKASKYGLYIKFSEEALFYRKGFHWEYITKDNIDRIYMRVEEVISHTSCCAENMDIQKLVVEYSDNERIAIHVCDGEPRLAERFYADIQKAWPDIEYGKK